MLTPLMPNNAVLINGTSKPPMPAVKGTDDGVPPHL